MPMCRLGSSSMRKTYRQNNPSVPASTVPRKTNHLLLDIPVTTVSDPEEYLVREAASGDRGDHLRLMSRRWFIGLAVLLLSSVVAIFAFTWHNLAPQHQADAGVSIAVPQPLSYQVMQLAQVHIKEVKPPPTTAALFYAYVAASYDDGLQANQAGALYASQQIMILFYPDKKTDFELQFALLAQKNKVDLAPIATSDNVVIQGVIDNYTKRHQNDGHDLTWNGTVPKGPGKWVKTASDPLTPRAGDWQRWHINQAISVPAPPITGSEADSRELDTVIRVSSARTGQDINKINFWGGTPGTETPSGIWQNQLFRTVKNELPADTLLADKNYSEVQKELAETLSDAFMECWKVKFTYWTARPNMRDSSITTAMENPVFPGYVSGHSTISKAAADVLSVAVPKHANEWQAMALEARDSRIKAGIHFEIDNVVGYDVGTAVAIQEISGQNIKSKL